MNKNILIVLLTILKETTNVNLSVRQNTMATSILIMMKKRNARVENNVKKKKRKNNGLTIGK